jgi:hypothetical protein
MIAAYSGPCIRIRRSTDNAEQDIGFSGQDVNAAAIASFADGGTAFVRTVYDQSGKGNHLVQSDNSRQPFYYAGLDDPTILFTGGAAYFVIPSSLTADRRACSMFAVQRDTTQAATPAYWYMGNSSTTGIGLGANVTQFGIQPFYDGAFANISPNDGTSDTTCSKCILGLASSSSGLTIHRDGATASSAALSSSMLSVGGCYGRTDFGGLSISARQDFFAFVFYPGGLSGSDATALKAVLATLYKTNDFWFPSINIAMQGDSKTFGASTPFNATVTRLLERAYLGRAIVRNFGISGHAIHNDLGGLLLAGNKYLESGKKNVAIISQATNDLSLGRTAAQIWTDYMTACAALRSGGWNKIIATTITPRTVSANAFTPAMEAERIQINNLLLANNGNLFDAIANYGSIASLGSNGNPNLTYLPDGLHENEAGNALEAALLKATVDSVL